MRSIYDNTFIRYGDPLEVEEVITDALVTTIRKLDPITTDYRDNLADLLSHVPTNKAKIHHEATASELRSKIEEKDIHMVGLSNQDDPEIPTLDKTHSLDVSDQVRFDIAIETGTGSLVIVEIKTQDSDFQKLDKYVQVLDIKDTDQISFVQWHDVVNTLSEIEQTTELEQVFVDDLRELIEYNSPSKTFSVVRYGEQNSGKNLFEIDRGPTEHQQTPYASERPPFALHIDVEESGVEDIYIAPGEWDALIDGLRSDAIEAFVNADFDYFEKFEDDGQTIHSKIGAHSDGQKAIQTSTTGDGIFVLGFRRRSAEAGLSSGRGKYPMLAKGEFEDFFGEKLSQKEREKLFNQRDLSVFLEDI